MAATFDFKVSQIAIPFLAEYADSLPILLNTNKQLDQEFKAGNGSTMNIILPDHPEVTSGAGIDEADLSYENAVKTLTLTQRKVAFGADMVARALSIKDFRGQVGKPMAQKLASQIQILAAKEVQLKAAHQIVLGGTKNFEEIGELIARIRDSRSYDDLYGALSPQLNSKVISSGIQFFNPAGQVSDMFRKAQLGTYNTVEFFQTPDVVGLVTGTAVFPVTANVKTTLTEGATTLIIQDAALTGTVKAGQGFTIEGVNAVDIYGKDLGTPYVFVAQADATAAANEISITIKPIYTAANNKALANVSAYPATTAVVTPLQDASSAYLGGIIWDKQALMFGSAKMYQSAGTEMATAEDAPNGITLTVTKGPDIMQGREIVRVDTLNGFLLARDNWAGVVWIKVA